MTEFLLDTNICIYVMKPDPTVLANLLGRAKSSIHVSVITEAELRAGTLKSAAVAKNVRHLDGFLSALDVVPFESADALVYAQVRATLEKAGTPIGPLDTLIAAHALSRGLTLVTNNARELKRVRNLKVENWAVAEKKA